MQEMLHRLQLRHYRLIQAISATGQLSRAAGQLRLTQPAASRTLAEIEGVVGERVFARNAKGMAPTPIGEILTRHAEALLHGLDDTAKEVAAFRAGVTGTVRVGAVTGAAVAYVVPAIQTLKTQVDNAEIRVDVAPSVELMAGLNNGAYDFALCRVPPSVDTRGLEIAPGHVEELEIVVRDGHPLGAADRLSLAHLAAMTWVVQAPGMPIREAVEKAFLADGMAPPRDIVDSASLLVMLAYVLGSDAVAPVPREVVALLMGAASARLRTLPLPVITMSHYHLISDAKRPISPLARRLRGLVLAAMAPSKTA